MQTALVVVDLQNYYLSKDYSFYRYFESQLPGSLSYIQNRCQSSVIPNTERLISFFRSRYQPILFLRLASHLRDRSDLHPAFQQAHQKALNAGFPDLYPMFQEEAAQIAAPIAPKMGEMIFDKTSYSAFTTTSIAEHLKSVKIDELVFAGLATSQCVETTARDAADRGFSITMIEDAQADYREETHIASLYSSSAVCGGRVLSTSEFLR